MSELQDEYKDRVNLVVVMPAEGAGQTIEGLEKNHGLVAYDADGKLVHSINGHDFGKDEVVDAISRVVQ